MKTIYLLPILLLITFTGFSQDTLFTKNGKTLPVKVVEIGLTDIHYRLTSNPEKLHSIDMSEVSSVHYANGTKDDFYYTSGPGKYNVAPDDSISNAIAKKDTPQNTDQNRVFSQNAKNQAIADAVFVGVRVIGFALRIALEIALASSGCHSSSGNYSNHSSGNNHPRGH